MIEFLEKEQKVNVKAFGDAVNRLRLRAGYRYQRDLAAKIGIDERYLSKIEGGAVPSAEIIIQLARACRVRSGELFEYLDDEIDPRHTLVLPEGLTEQDVALVRQVAERLAAHPVIEGLPTSPESEEELRRRAKIKQIEHEGEADSTMFS